jgi:hypothetical protein
MSRTGSHDLNEEEYEHEDGGAKVSDVLVEGEEHKKFTEAEVGDRSSPS